MTYKYLNFVFLFCNRPLFHPRPCNRVSISGSAGLWLGGSSAFNAAPGPRRSLPEEDANVQISRGKQTLFKTSLLSFGLPFRNVPSQDSDIKHAALAITRFKTFGFKQLSTPRCLPGSQLKS